MESIIQLKTNIVDIAIIVSTVEISIERLEARIYEKLSRIKIGTKYEIRKNKWFLTSMSSNLVLDFLIWGTIKRTKSLRVILNAA